MGIIEAEGPPVPDELMQRAQELYNYIDKSNDPRIQKLSQIYDYLKDFSSFVQPFSKCSKGCSYCCSYGVSITAFEAEYISFKTGIEYSRAPLFTQNDNVDCPFLGERGDCSIYDCRPIICRLLHTLGNPENCKIGVGQEQSWYGSQGSNFSNPVYNELMRWVSMQNLLSGGEVRDIRYFFTDLKIKQLQSLFGKL